MGRKMILREEERCDAIVSIISFLFLPSFLGFYFFLLSMERSEIVVVVVIFKVMIFKVYCPRCFLRFFFFFHSLACLSTILNIFWKDGSPLEYRDSNVKPT